MESITSITACNMTLNDDQYPIIPNILNCDLYNSPALSPGWTFVFTDTVFESWLVDNMV